MAALAVLPAMNGDKALHPFFTKPNTRHETDETNSSDEVQVADGVTQLDGASDDGKKTKHSKRPRGSRLTAQTNGKTQKTLQEIVNPASIRDDHQTEEPEAEVPDSCPFEPLSSSPRPKRQRISGNGYVEVGAQNDSNETMEHPPQTRSRSRSSPQVIVPASPSPPAAAPETDELAAKTPPKKMLRLNASGKFSSPISKGGQNMEPAIEAPKRRGRPRKSKEVDSPKHLIVVMRYTNAGAIGPKIDRVMAGEERITKAQAMNVTPKKQRTPRKPQLSKATHPFFLGKPKEEQQPPPKQESPRKASAVTPGKLRRQTMSERSSKESSARVTQDYVVGSGLLKDRMMLKQPNAKEPSWPSKEHAHIRNLDDVELQELGRISKAAQVISRRKRKAAKKLVHPDVSLLNQFSLRLKPDEDGMLRSDGFREPHPSLTLPKKLLVCGEEIARKVTCEISGPFREKDEDELVRPSRSQLSIHPAVSALYDRIPQFLSAIDDGKGETTSWVQKYAPATAAEVLQPNREMNILKDWLTKLTITAVESSLRSEAKLLPKSEPKRRKKKRGKHGDMDDFLVSDDDDIRDMDEVPESEDGSPSFLGERRAVKSVVQIANEGVKSSNTLLLSGPHGCGKTASAYAVAKELGFKVFEISPCERRSGKDIMDKVGDMTENHLVKHHGTDTGETSSTEMPTRLDEAFQKDLESGRQGKMNAFFKPKAKAKQASPKKKAATQKKSVLESVQKAIRKPPKDQQQSLILLEEVDILFKEDKEFWNTVVKLVQSSKRPFIMTCNDEDLVPLQLMSFHAILRFSPTPVELATDYMLLVAAAEGHLLKRDAVQSLYQFKGCDLRASIAELDFWCQMGVGDPRGGLSWIFQRYPPGSDLDADGRKLRVVSEGTYVTSMGLLPDDHIEAETQLLHAYREFGINSDDLLNYGDLPVDKISLKDFDRLSNSMSAADVYAGQRHVDQMDLTQPPMPDKARSQYIEALQVLQTDECTDYLDLTQQLGIATTLAAYGTIMDLTAEHLSSKLRSAIQSKKQLNEKDRTLSRRDFTCFDSISVPSETALFATPGLVQSAFDGPLTPITIDVAPYVRSIVQFDLALAGQRERMSGILGDARHAKRARTTRAARSALEGGQRASTRREKWFTKELDVNAVLSTAGEDWPKTGLEALDVASRDGTETPSSSADVAEAD